MFYDVISQKLKLCNCYDYGLGRYKTLERAQSACTIDNNCQGVSDIFCDETGILNAFIRLSWYMSEGRWLNESTYCLCPNHAQLKTSRSYCFYTKRKKLFNFQIMVKIK